MERLHLSQWTLRLTALGFALLWGLSAAGQRHAANPAPRPLAHAPPAFTTCNEWGGQTVARTELFFGLARPDGSTLGAGEFQSFVDSEITPRFPRGLTLLGGSGQYRDINGATIRENSKLLILLYPYEREASGKIEAIRAAYIKAFAQQAVLRVDGASCLS